MYLEKYIAENMTFQTWWDTDKSSKGKFRTFIIAFNLGWGWGSGRLESQKHSTQKAGKEQQSKPKVTRRKIYQREEKKSIR